MSRSVSIDVVGQHELGESRLARRRRVPNVPSRSDSRRPTAASSASRSSRRRAARGVARGLGDDIGDRAGADHVARGELGGVGRSGPSRAASACGHARSRSSSSVRGIATVSCGPAQLEVTAAAVERDARSRRARAIASACSAASVAALVVQRIGVGEKRHRIAQARGGERGREQRALRALLGDEQRRDRDRRAAGGRARARAGVRRRAGRLPRGPRSTMAIVRRRARGDERRRRAARDRGGQHDAELGGRPATSSHSAASGGCSASSPSNHASAGARELERGVEAVAVDADRAAAAQRRARCDRGE